VTISGRELEAEQAAGGRRSLFSKPPAGDGAEDNDIPYAPNQLENKWILFPAIFATTRVFRASGEIPSANKGAL